MDVNQNFERLEKEVIRLMEVLEMLRKENLEQKEQIQNLERDIGITNAENERLKPIETAHEESNRGKEEIKGRIENILSRLDGLNL
jgi:predicted nucleotide-binding protein (sugar kinase/HSP70/actin superfamily)